MGDDQQQHLELCRVIAEKFNRIVGSDCLAVPKAVLAKEVCVANVF